MRVEVERIRPLNDASVRADGDYVLYWMQMNRRVQSNQALIHAADLANEMGVPLLVYEGLTCTYPSANDRIHSFMLEAVPETGEALTDAGIGYFFYLRARKADANDVVYQLAAKACCVVTDDYPTFIASKHNSSVPNKIGVACIAVDASCIVPMSCHQKRAYGAYTIRPKIKRELPKYLKAADMPKLNHRWHDGLVSKNLLKLRTKVATGKIAELVAGCEIDHDIRRSPVFTGGYGEARRRLNVFLEHRLSRYAKESNQPAKHATSELSPYLHFGQISELEIALAVKEYAEEHHLIADDFLEELIVRRELAFNFARFTENPKSLDSVPDWCRKTMAKHAKDKRPVEYTAHQLEQARTYDALWNATQKELLFTGKIHGYYRMYWGKKIIEWSPTYEDALRVMIDLHDTYALDGRDPNTYTNILWCFGLHDRPWGERPIFGQLRYMSLDGMKRKTDVGAYIREIESLEAAQSEAIR